MSYKHILFATDLSDNSKEAGKRARALADENSATLDIVHVVEHFTSPFGGEMPVPVNVTLEQTLEAEIRKMLLSHADALNISPEHQHLIIGSVKRSVLQLADDLKVDLIVVGTHGHRGLDILLGSSANAILHGAKCDVLAVRAHT